MINKSWHFIVVLLLLQFSFSKATDLNKLNWQEGEVILMNGTRLSGKVVFDPKTNIVKIKDELTIKAFTPVNVISFKIQDNKFLVKRNYFALPVPDRGKNIFQFYEVIYEGKVALLSRPMSLNRVIAEIENIHVIDEGSDDSLVKVDRFYIMKMDGEVYELDSDLHNLFNILGNSLELINFVKEKELDLQMRQDLVKLMMYYDTLNQFS